MIRKWLYLSTRLWIYTHTHSLTHTRSSRREVFCKKAVLICQEGLSLLLPVSCDQNRSIFPGGKIYVRTPTNFPGESCSHFPRKTLHFQNSSKIARKSNHLVEEQMICLVLMELAASELVDDQVDNNFRWLLISVSAQLILAGRHELYIVVSSAYCIVFNCNVSWRSFTYRLNSTGPKIDPCGTP